jgi:hypothetical protein
VGVCYVFVISNQGLLIQGYNKDFFAINFVLWMREITFSDRVFNDIKESYLNSCEKFVTVLIRKKCMNQL